MKTKDIETPALVLDYDKFMSNIDTMFSLIKDSGIQLRPHFKSHKCTEISKKLVAAGAKGITCSKLGEAEVLTKAGIGDILIANQVTQLSKIERVAKLAKETRLTICADNKENIDALSQACHDAGSVLYVLVEYEVGMHRCGVLTKEAFLDLAKYIMAKDNLVFEGIQAYGGHNSLQPDTNEREAAYLTQNDRVKELRDYLFENGITCSQISGGSTGTSYLKAKDGLYTELQAGSFTYMDSTYLTINKRFVNALFLMTSVVSYKEDLFVTDGGIKSCTCEFGDPTAVAYPDIKPRMCEEHISMDVKNHGLKLNDSVLFKPSHCCTTMNLHDVLYIIRGEEVLETVKIDGRGKFV